MKKINFKNIDSTWFKFKFKSIHFSFGFTIILIFILITSLAFYLNLNPSSAKIIDVHFAPLLTQGPFSMGFWLSRKIPVSLLELFWHFFFFFILIFFYLIIKKKYKAIHTSFRILLLFLILLIHWFYLAWGYRYYIPPTFGNIGGFKPTPKDFVVLSEQVALELKEFSSRPKVFVPNENTSKEQLEPLLPKLKEAIEAYLVSQNITNHPPQSLFLPHIKSFSLSPYSMKIFGISGVYNPWFGEVHVNKDLPFGTQMFTLIHELAHAYGINSEYQANVIAYEVSRQLYSHDAVRYSLLLNMSFYLLPHLDSNQFATFFHDTIPLFAKQDILDYYDYWENIFTPLARLNRQIYDVFLKSSNIEDGVQSYGRFISYVIHQGNLPQKID